MTRQIQEQWSRQRGDDTVRRELCHIPKMVWCKATSYYGIVDSVYENQAQTATWLNSILSSERSHHAAYKNGNFSMQGQGLHAGWLKSLQMVKFNLSVLNLRMSQMSFEWSASTRFRRHSRIMVGVYGPCQVSSGSGSTSELGQGMLRFTERSKRQRILLWPKCMTWLCLLECTRESTIICALTYKILRC